MALENLITEEEAAGFTGVSLQTLARFAEAGYLTLEADRAGRRAYSRAQLTEVFGLPGVAPQDPSQSIPSRLDERQKAVSIERPKRVPPAAASHPSPDPSSSEPSRLRRAAEIALQANTRPESSERREALAREAEPAAPRIQIARSISPSREPVNPVVEEISPQGMFNPLEVEVTKLRSVVALQDKLLDLRDSQIKDLREEREWLRSRIEKLDEKSDRDQLLLLSETQTIRKLVTQNQAKRSALRSALEWLGVVEPNAGVGATPMIELSRKDSEALRGTEKHNDTHVVQ